MKIDNVTIIVRANEGQIIKAVFDADGACIADECNEETIRDIAGVIADAGSDAELPAAEPEGDVEASADAPA